LELKDRCVVTCQEILQQYKTEGDDFLRCIVTVDEGWVHCFQHETKEKQRLAPFKLIKDKKFLMQVTAEKEILTLFRAL
jgi:hypothetical protein